MTLLQTFCRKQGFAQKVTNRQYLIKSSGDEDFFLPSLRPMSWFGSFQIPLSSPLHLSLSYSLLTFFEFVMFSRYFKILQGAENTTIPPSKRSKYQALYEEALKNFTMIHFFYKELGIVRYSRDELYGKV